MGRQVSQWAVGRPDRFPHRPSLFKSYPPKLKQWRRKLQRTQVYRTSRDMVTITILHKKGILGLINNVHVVALQHIEESNVHTALRCTPRPIELLHSEVGIHGSINNSSKVKSITRMCAGFITRLIPTREHAEWAKVRTYRTRYVAWQRRLDKTVVNSGFPKAFSSSTLGLTTNPYLRIATAFHNSRYNASGLVQHFGVAGTVMLGTGIQRTIGKWNRSHVA